MKASWSVYIQLLGLVGLLDQIHARRVFVRTKLGGVIGWQWRGGQRFLGIPFAEPPKRWQAPEEVTPWRRWLRAYSLKPACHQRACEGSFPKIACNKQMSEDCLYLNIYSQRNTHRSPWYARKAVMVFIHGGSFTRGTASAPFYNGAALARRNVIVVTFNYRIGALGFLVTGSTSGDITGNYGLKDQRMALKWVYDNIQSFGGDRNKITIFGQSAGALSVVIHLTSGKVDKLFRSAIIESAPFSIPMRPMSVAVTQGAGVAALLNCSPSNITCLKEKSPDEILDAQEKYNTPFPDSALRSGIRWIPSIDCDEVKWSVPAFSKFTNKPVIIGTTTEEGQYFVPSNFPQAVNSQYLAGYLYTLFPKRAAELLTKYIPRNSSDVRPELVQINTDFLFTCSAFSVARNILSKTSKVYHYIFDATVLVDGFWNTLDYCEGRVCHNSDLAYIFPSVYARKRLFTRSEWQLARRVVTYWTNFARFGSPNRRAFYQGRSPKWLFWPKYDIQSKKSILFDLTNTTSHTSHARDDVCKIWDKGLYRA